MEITTRKTIKRKLSDIQLDTCNLVKALEAKQGKRICAKDIQQALPAKPKLSTLENRLRDYAQRGWLAITIPAKYMQPAIYGITKEWSTLMDALSTGYAHVSARTTDTVSRCENCDTQAILIKYRAKRLCPDCLNPVTHLHFDDSTHLLVRSNWDL